MADQTKVLIERRWPVTRVGTVEEVIKEDGSIRFRTSILDLGREQPFLVRWFNDPTPAADFLDKVEGGNYPIGERNSR